MPNKKFPSFAEYAKNNGGLERFMDNPKDRKEFAHREFMYDEAVAGIDFDFPLTVYRALELFEGEEVKFDGAGVWWTTSLDSADAYFGATSIWTPRGKAPQKSRIVTLTAQVLKEADVDWEKTLEANVINPDENEVTMRVGAQMRLIAIDGESIQKRMIIAAAEETVKPVVFKIEVPGDRRENFWNRPDGKMEFWAFKDRPRAFLEERIIFTFDGKPVAEAKVLKIEEPGTTACGATGQYRDHHKVFWNSTHFKKYASNGNVILYHGTTWEKADSIQQQGFKASANEVTDGKKYVWCSTDEQEATWYGMSAASEAGDENRYAVVKFAWDWDKSEPDPEHTKFGEDPNVFRRIESDIPASAIRGVYYFRGGKRVKGTEKTAGGWIGPVFHGTIGNFAKLKGQPDAAGMTYFTDDAEYANNFTKKWTYVENSAVYPAYIKFNKPFDARNWSEEKITPEDYAKAIGADLSEMKAQMPKFFQLLMDKGTGTWFWRYLLLLPHISKAALMKQGYDGIILMEAIDKYQSPDTTSFVVFKDSQIKPFFGPKGKPKNVIDLQGSEKTADHVNDEGFWAGEGNAASGVLPVCPPKGTVCLAMRSSEVMTPNCWGTLGGAVQRGMSPQDSAKTEMAEETGFHGGIRLIPAFVFSAGGGFKYHNFIGVVQAEFGFNPSEEHSWETDYIQWLPYAEVVADMQANPGNYHPGLLKLFAESRDKIEKALGLENKTASKPDLKKLIKMHDTIKELPGRLRTRETRDAESVSRIQQDKLTRLADAIEKYLPKASRGHLAQARRALEDADVAYHNYQNSREPDFDGDEELSHVLNYQETALMILHQILREAERGKTASGLQFREEMRGAHHGQNDMTLFAEVNGRTVGYLEYAVYQGESSVQWLEVSDKRKGYGTALLKKLQSMYPDTEVNLGMTTEDGTALVDKIKFEEKPTEHAGKFKELDSLKPEKDRLEAVAESYYAVEGHTEEENKAFMSDMEKLNEINDRVWELEQELRSKSPSKRLIATKKGNTATWNGKPFWSGAVSVLDGQIEEVHSYKEAAEVDFHHSFYFSPESQELMRSEESAFFCVYSDGSILVNATGRNKLSEDQKLDLERRVLQQIVIGVKEKKADQQHLFPDSQDARFQQWFNGSKVVDAKGQPLPVYHGTRSSVDFDTFAVDGPPVDDSDFEGQPTSSGSGADPTALMGAHFSVEPGVANQFAEGKGWTGTRYEGEQPKPRVMKVFLRITNPKDFGSEHNLREFINQGKIHGDAVDLALRNDLGVDEFEEDDADGSMQKWYDKYDNDTTFRVEQNTYLFEQHRRAEGDDSVLDEAAYDLAAQARGRLEAAGHDGIHYKNVVEGGTAWIAFDPNQIKSAWAQSFNPRDPRFTASDERKIGRRSQPDPNMKQYMEEFLHTDPDLHETFADFLQYKRKEESQNWIKSAAGFAFKSFKKLWHVGTLNVKDKGSDSLEGAGLSVSVNPEEWQEIARLGGDLWEFTKNGNKFVNFHRITPAQKKAITEWGVQNGLVLSATVWQITYWDDEAEEERHFNMDTEQEAKDEASEFEGAKIRPMNNKLLGTEKLVQRSNNPSAKNTALAFDLLVTIYAEDVLDCDGVWWQDTLDPLNLSAPRGVIFPSKLPSWAKRKLSENDNGVLEFSSVAAVEPDSVDTDPEVEFERTYKYVKTLSWRGMNPWYPEKYPWTALRVLTRGWELKDELNNKLIAKGSDLESLKTTLAKYDLNKLRSEAPSKTIDAEPIQKKLNA